MINGKQIAYDIRQFIEREENSMRKPASQRDNIMKYIENELTRAWRDGYTQCLNDHAQKLGQQALNTDTQ